MAIESYKDLANFLIENGEWRSKYSNERKEKAKGYNYDYILKHLKNMPYIIEAIKALESVTDFSMEYWKKMRGSLSYQTGLMTLHENGLLNKESLTEINKSTSLQRSVSLLRGNSLLGETNYTSLVASKPLRETLSTLYNVSMDIEDQETFEALKKPLLQNTIAALDKTKKLDMSTIQRIIKKPEEQKKLLISSDEEFARQLQQQELKGSKYKSVDKFVGAELLFYKQAHDRRIKAPVLENIDNAPEL
ncbi:hypothetical protein ACR9PT_11140 [Piscirickettsia salmonis]|uniref:hypothetical protein n=1 Tax=Piscirickettsia salmonis TaxID=1238 RepID=UPI003EB71DAE